MANSSNLTQTYSNFIGKLFQLTKCSVTVEDVIAEGKHFIFDSSLSLANNKIF
jgi:hypothetical protein